MSSVSLSPGFSGLITVGIVIKGFGLGGQVTASSDNRSSWKACTMPDNCPGQYYDVDLHIYIHNNLHLVLVLRPT
jgi:hypothetical protein